MSNLQATLRQYFRQESGATAVEYGLVIGLIALAIVGGITAIATSINGTFTEVETTMS
ncbi:MAG: Flp family type IVb pilin [Alphaproteobacteria bacterium]|nr:Flp family type IVb pilin [Hyphomonas sp.]MBR9806349.1 Flp family type IVb pilin [Alphaproteobacteria bacterium]|tara:strand:- start:5269 stop:5442 length:174 start_codon:yes stop_codon:yes gene_type:complete